MKKYILFAVFALFAFLAKPVFADGINLSLVNTSYDYSFPADAYLEDSSMGYGLTYNWHLNPTWSIDIGYTDYGSGTRSFGFLSTEVETTSFSVAARASMVIGTISSHDIKAHALLGAVMADMDISAGANTLSDSDTGLLYGVGLSAVLSPTDELTFMVKMADLEFNNNVTFEYNPTTIELGYTRRF